MDARRATDAALMLSAREHQRIAAVLRQRQIGGAEGPPAALASLSLADAARVRDAELAFRVVHGERIAGAVASGERDDAFGWLTDATLASESAGGEVMFELGVAAVLAVELGAGDSPDDSAICAWCPCVRTSCAGAIAVPVEQRVAANLHTRRLVLGSASPALPRAAAMSIADPGGRTTSTIASIDAAPIRSRVLALARAASTACGMLPAGALLVAAIGAPFFADEERLRGVAAFEPADMSFVNAGADFIGA